MSTQSVWKEYEKQGILWANNQLYIEKFNDIYLNDKQWEFVNDKSRYCLVSGGFASGKTTAFIVKMILLSLWFPGNRILLGRRTRQDVETNTLPDFFDICPQGIYEHKVGLGKIVFGNGSEIIFFGLDALQNGSGQDIKKAEQKIKSLNLGAVFIDQLEEVEQRIFEALTGRLRRNVPFQQMNFTTNPANFWAYDYFKVNPRPNTKLIETSMLDNKESLSEEFIKDQLSKDKRYVDRYVYGIWSPDTMVQGGVFPEDHLKQQAFYVKQPIREFDGIKIWKEPVEGEYQLGIDSSDGSVDPSCIKVVDKLSGEEVASYTAYIPIAALADKAIQIAKMYSFKFSALIVPEANAGGAALIEHLKIKGWSRIYEREVFLQREAKTSRKLGFYTNAATKTQLIENFKELMQKKFVILREKDTLEEMKTFIYTNEARLKGAGAQDGYHDDKVMAIMLAYWGVKALSYNEKNILDRLKRQTHQTVVQYEYD